MSHYSELFSEWNETAKKEWEAYIDGKDVDLYVPDHYNHTIQPWDYMESVMSEEAFLGYLEGNVIKYISRWRDKGGVKDLEKCKHYINKLIEAHK